MTRAVATAASCVLAVVATILPALAHPGSHEGLGFAALIEHYASGWHALSLIVAAGAGLGAFVIGRRRQARVGVETRRRRDEA
ncbi:MAG: hypothetical protein SFW09_17025 [Hyphomicrobiaceae bacterium]|nr:hypothetical protein [Hyphomicrobiaceae bacterium]